MLCILTDAPRFLIICLRQVKKTWAHPMLEGEKQFP